MNNETPKEISPELKAENSKIANMFFLASLLGIFSTVFYKFLSNNKSPRFQKYTNMLMNWCITFMLVVIVLTFLNVSEKTARGLGFLNLCYCAYASGIIRRGSEFKFIFTIKFFKEEI